jgi:hypothetical protein
VRLFQAALRKRDVFSPNPGIAMDRSSNVFAAGKFAGTIDFDPGPGVANRIPAGSDIFASTLAQ